MCVEKHGATSTSSGTGARESGREAENDAMARVEAEAARSTAPSRVLEGDERRRAAMEDARSRRPTARPRLAGFVMPKREAKARAARELDARPGPPAYARARRLEGRARALARGRPRACR